jgi:lincosamide nucleotidyltransferase A/C/D/E
VLWRLPLPRRVLVRLSGILYRSPPMPAEVVVGIVDAMHAAGLRCWVVGGWGVDALVGRATRTHRDVDLAVEHQDMEKATQVLLGLGYREWYRVDPDVPLLTQIVFTDHPVAGRAVDLHPLGCFGSTPGLTTGEMAGRPVPCLTVATQVANRTFDQRTEWTDLALLRELERAPGSQAGQAPGGQAGQTRSTETS